MNFALVVLVKSSALLLGILSLALASKKASAAARHTIWVVGLLSILLLPLVSILLPEFSVVLRPDSNKAAWITNAVAVAQTYGPPNQVIAVPPLPASHINKSLALGLKDWFVLLWGIGASLIVIRFVMGVRDVRGLRRNSRTVVDTQWRELLRDLKQELSVSPSVQLRIGGTGIPPMTWGILRHTILFPSSASRWTEDRLRHAIAHELAHVKRRDGIVQLLVQAACSVYWFHPLVWYAAYRVRIERERACDDRVLSIGAVPEDYADNLLQIARETASHLGFAGVAMTHRSGFGTRVNAILEPDNNRNALSSRATMSLAGSVALLTVLLSTLQLRALPMPLPRLLLPSPLPTAVETSPTVAKRPEREKLQQIQTPPKWAGTWRLNKQNSRFGSDPKIQELLDSIDTITWTLEVIPNGMKVTADLVGIRPGQRQHTEMTVPFGVRLNVRDLNPIAALLPPTSVLVTPLGNDSLQLTMNELQSLSIQDLRIDVSNDGNTLIETLSPPDDLRIVFDKL